MRYRIRLRKGEGNRVRYEMRIAFRVLAHFTTDPVVVSSTKDLRFKVIYEYCYALDLYHAQMVQRQHVAVIPGRDRNRPSWSTIPPKGDHPQLSSD